MHSQETLQLNDPSIKQAKFIYRAINHNLRRKILELIHSKKKMMVTEIYRELNLEQPVASLHLGILKKARIVNTEREGRNMFYSVNYKRIKQIHLITMQLLGLK